MSRLIDADAFIEYVNRRFDLCSDELRMMIEEQPTAYDAEKVVAELEDAKFLMPPENDNHYADNGLFLEDAIDIVRRGGVE